MEREDPDVIFQPMPGKVVVRVMEDSEFLVNRGNTIILRAATAQRPRTTGVIIAIPEPWRPLDEKEEIESFLQIGDKVIFGQHSGIEVQYGKSKVIVLREVEILTKVVVKNEADLREVGVAEKDFDDLP